MKITYTPNPLMSVVELDDVDRGHLKTGIMSDRLFDLVVRAQHFLREGNVDHVAKILDEIDQLEEYIERRVPEYEAELRQAHLGDCICVPCSCTKCRVEYHVGINTLAGLNKHTAHKIAGAFGGASGADGNITIEQALESLANYDPKPWPQDRELWDSCMPRWKEEAAAAHAWLLRYMIEKVIP